MGKKAVTGLLPVVAGLMAAGVLAWALVPRLPRVQAVARPEAGPATPPDDADRLARLLRKHPAQPSKRKEGYGLYLMDVDQGTVTLIADEPAPGLTHCGSARWSRDGKRVLFDATPGANWNQTHVFAIEIGDEGPKRTDLGPGNCPSPSPDGRLVAFLLNGGAVPGAGSGLWFMNADGSGRRRVGSYGRPFWSPDNRHLMIVSFSDPCQLTLMDVETRKSRPVQVAGQGVYSIPSWVDENTIVAALGSEDGRAIALVDVTDPEHARVKEVLREKDGKPSVTPAYPVYSATSRRCLFVNANPKGMSLYSVPQEKAARPRRLEKDGFDKTITDIAASPDGRYLVFCSDRAVPKAP